MLRPANNSSRVLPRSPWRTHPGTGSRSTGSGRTRVHAAGGQAVSVTAASSASLASLGFPFASLGLRAFLGFAIAPFASSAFRRLFRRRRPRHRALATMDGSSKAIFSVATFNLRGVMDRWHEREPLLRQCLQQVDADVLCFQEVLTGEFGQEGRVLPAWYHVFPCKAALFNLARSGGVLRWYAQTVSRMLALPPLRRVMVSLPAAVEGWRERLRLRSDFFRTLRDLAMAPFFGNSVACRIAEAHEIKHSTLVLGDWRAAQRIEFYIGKDVPRDGGQPGEAAADGQGSEAQGWRQQQRQQRRQRTRRSSFNSLERGGSSGNGGGERSVLSGGEGGFKVWVCNTHLDHEHPDNRQRQALAVCDWMDREKADCAAIILCGDFNGAPCEPFHAALRRLGYVSAHVACHGSEPQGTWPTGIKAPLMDEGEFECLDYLYVWTAPDFSVKVLSAEVFGLHPAAHDKTLYPSDHAAVKATLEISRKVPVDLQEGSQKRQQLQQPKL